MNIFGKKKRIYLDYASTTPLSREVFSAMKPFFSDRFENPSSIYREGVLARRVVDDSRSSIARMLLVRPEEIIFTGSGTEANNIALLGVFRAAKRVMKNVPHIVTTKIEHPSILEVCKQIEREGGEVTYVGVSKSGVVDPKEIVATLRPETILVTVMYANNEIGTIQPMKEIARAIKHFKKQKREGDFAGAPFFHTDASQAANYLSLKTDSLGVDMLTLDASKIYGPKGIGLLFVRKDVPLSPIIFGGGQEKGIRSGTENVPAIVGFAKALELVAKLREGEVSRLTVLRDYFISELLKKFSPTGRISLNGHLDIECPSLPNIVNICFLGLNAEFAVIQLDEAGVCVASASACKNLSDDSASYVIEETSGPSCSQSSLRFSLGPATTKKELDRVIKVLNKVLVQK